MINLVNFRPPAWMKRLAEERGANATEYGLLMSLIMMIVIAGITLYGLELLGWYDELTVHLKLVLGIP